MTTTDSKTKSKKTAEHPSYESMIFAAVSNLKERKGSSRPAIKKYILANYKVSPGAHFDSQISGAIRRGAAKDVFSLPKGLSGTVKLVKPVKKTSEKTAEKKTSASKKSESAKKTSAKKVVKKKAAPVANATAKA
ncbi:unnamed protein product [Mucor circinelloides]|uniref:Histone H1 n=1 Tax=Mucor circinelloides f. circinelloides (strain 1006PhL) TaxID=1220926 RepID=S2JQ64_MUCC1|nr:histone H1/5 [Mucor circinelloides 1006PhL]KAG1104831.1 hypothetical protein G6F42_017035 [Rhizopus arrhizus]